MGLDVTVRISSVQPIGSAGFGLPLILEENASLEKPYTVCSSVAEVVSAGYAEETKTYKAASLLFMQDNAPNQIAVCSTDEPTATWLNDVDNVNKDWRQLIVVNNSETPTAINAIMAKVDGLDDKMYFADLKVDDSTTLSVSGIKRTVLFYVTDAQYPSPSAALVGATAGLPAGSVTYKNMILKGIAPQSLTDTAMESIHSKGGITFVTKAGDNVTSEGKVAGGEYIDVIDAQDYIISNLKYRTQKLLNTSPKVPYDNNGIAMLQSICVDVMNDAYGNGIIATNEDGTPAYTVNYAMREEVSDTDKQARRYVGGQFSFVLQGGVHTVEITGEIII